MHIAALIAGAFLTLNCGFFSFYLLRMNLRMRRVMKANGLWDNDFLVENPKLLIVPAVHAIGLSIGVGLLWWGGGW